MVEGLLGFQITRLPNYPITRFLGPCLLSCGGLGALCLLRLLRLGLLLRFLAPWYLPRWRQDHVHGVTLHAWPKLNRSLIANIGDETLQNVAAQVLVCHLASTKAQAGFDLVALRQKTQHMVPFGHVIVLVHVDAEFHLFQDNLFLVLLCRPLFLFLLVEVFAVIHDPADRRNSIGGNFYQVEIDLAGLLDRLIGWHDAKLISIRINHAYLTRADALIHANKTLIYATLLGNPRWRRRGKT